MSAQQSRQRKRHMRVPVLEYEEANIKANALSCGLPAAAFLRALGQNYTPKSILDNEAVIELSRINADLGRMGGLLKMWLTNDERLKLLGDERGKRIIETLLNNIRTNQSLMRDAIRRL